MVVLILILQVFFSVVVGVQSGFQIMKVANEVFGFGGVAKVFEIGGSGLQGKEKKAGAPGFEAALGESGDDLHEGALDGGGVLEQGEGEARLPGREVAVAAHTMMEITEVLAAQGGRARLRPVELNVLTTRNHRWFGHGDYLLNLAVSADGTRFSGCAS